VWTTGRPAPPVGGEVVDDGSSHIGGRFLLPTLTDELRPVFAGRKVVLTGGPLAALTGVCRRLRELGAERPFLLATGIGTGEVPGPDEAEWCVVEVRAPDVVAEIRAAMRLLRLLRDEVVDALDRWDPERQALVLSPMFNELPQIAGRRVYGPRRPEWRRRLLPALGPRRAGRGRGGRSRWSPCAVRVDPPALRRGGTAPTGRLPGRLHRRRGARGRGIPAHRAEPAPAAPGR
jgi:hypothetical protein